MNLLDNQRAADIPAGIYQDVEEELMANIVRHLKDWNQPIDSDTWLLQKMAEMGTLSREHLDIISRSAGVSETAVERMLQEAAEEAVEKTDKGFRALAKKNLASATVVNPKRSRNVEDALNKLSEQAKDALNLCNTTMLYKAKDAYTKLALKIADTGKVSASRQEYLDVMNKHAATLVVGGESRQQAVRNCIKEFNEKGIPAFVDKKGREWTPEAYVNMNMRNTVRQTAEEMQTARCKDFGVNFISIDSHSGARPKCAKDQGKIFSLDNTSGTALDLHDKKIKYYPWNSSSYGEPDGILGINCRHHKSPFIPGISVQRYFPTEDFDANDKLYKETQVQRALERDVRKKKRECMLFDQMDDKDGFEDASVKLKRAEAKLKNYVDNNDQLHRRKDREQVVGFDKSISARAISAKKRKLKTVANVNDNVIINDIKIGRSLSAKAKNYEILEPNTGDYFNFVEGTKIQDVQVFAGKGCKKNLNEEVAEGLEKQIGGKASEWQHVKGNGVIDFYGEERKAEVHWFQEKSVGKHKFKVKRWLDES